MKPEPRHSIGFLVGDVSRLLRRCFDRRVQPLGLTQAQWRAILHLSVDEGLKQAELAARLDVTPISLGRLVDRMQVAGWIERRPDPSDRRASRLYLTEKAQPILEGMRRHAAETLDEALAGFSTECRETLRKALLQMKENLSPPASSVAAKAQAETRNHDGARTRRPKSRGRRRKP